MKRALLSSFQFCAFWIGLLTLILTQLVSQALASRVFDYDANGNLTAVRAAVAGPPVIETQPLSQVVDAGSGAGLTVFVSSSSPASFQWKREDGSNVAGATGDSLYFAEVSPSVEGAYYVVVTNASGSVTSTMAVLYVDSNGNSLPDTWEMAYFGNLAQTAAGDPDADGVSNRDEYNQGTNPLKAEFSANGIIWSVAMQGDGKVLLGGEFTTAGGVPRNRIARLHADGSLDRDFSPDLNGILHSIAVQPDGKILIGGGFTTVSGVARNRLARLNADGSLDADFNPDVGSTVRSVAVQLDGRVLIGGQFTTVGGVSRNRIARLSANGVLDTGFNPSANNWVHSVAVQADGKLLMGGEFTTIGGVARNRIARLSADGTLDSGFNPNANSNVFSLVPQNDGKVVIGGGFTTVGAVARGRFARLNADGTLDTGFNPNANGEVYSLALQGDGKVLAGGAFTTMGGVTRNRIARLNADGSLDAGFDPNANGDVYTVAMRGDGSVLLGGPFTALGGVTRNRVARLVNDPATQSLTLPDATRVRWTRIGAVPEVSDVVFEQSLDNGATWSVLGSGTRVGMTANWERTGLSLGVGAKVRATGRTTDGQRSQGLIRQMNPVTPASMGSVLTAALSTGSASAGTSAMILGGAVTADAGDLSERGFVYAMTAVNSNPQTRGVGVVKLAVSGTGSGSFNSTAAGLVPGTTYSYRSYATNSLGTTYSAVGTFTTAALGAAPGDLGGSIDPAASWHVYSAALQADGKVVIGGAFTSMGGARRNGIARLNSDGTLDASYNPNVNGDVWSLATLADGKVVIGGDFTAVGGVTRNRLARLNADGSLDAGFEPNVGGTVRSVVAQLDGRVLIGGQFTTVGGVARNRIARLSANGVLDTGFNPNANNWVHSVAVQADGRVLIGGQFTMVGGVARNRIARLSANGTLDNGFNPGANSSVSSLVPQKDGKVILGGDFTMVGGISRSGIARLNADGSPDTGFNPSANGEVYSLAVQVDGRVLAGGAFTTMGGMTRHRIARLNADGSLDAGFDPNADGDVYSVMLRSDGRVLLGGAFTTMGGVTRNRVALLANEPATQSLALPDATRVLWSRSGAMPEISDVVFESSADNGVTWNVLGAGVRGSGTASWELGGVNVSAGAKVRATGRTTDGHKSQGLIRQVHPMTPASMGGVLTANVSTGSASAGTSAMVLGGAVTADGDAEIAERGFVYSVTAVNSAPRIGGVGVVKQAVAGTAVGSFSAVASGLLPATTYSYSSYATNSIGTTYSAVGTFITAALGAAPGDLEAGIDPDASWHVYSAALQADGKVVIGGAFTSMGGARRNGIARLNSDGTLDASYNPNVNGDVWSLATLADGKVVIGGDFTAVGGVTRNRLARLNADGSLDAGFDPNVGGTVRSVVAQLDGRVLIGGQFTTVGGVARNRIARLSANGVLDTGFNPDANGWVYSVAVQADGKVIIGGGFTTIGGVGRNGIARLNADGTWDTGFNPNVNSNVFSLAPQADGKVVIGGTFSTVGSVSRSGIARLNADGSPDTGFNPSANGEIYSLAVQADGKVLAGGAFTTMGGMTRHRIARLNSSGNVDIGFDINANGDVYSVMLRADGRMLLGGAFTMMGGVIRNRVALLANDPATQSLTLPDATRVLWTRSGAVPEVSDVIFESRPANGTAWSLLGAGARVNGTASWQLAGLSLDVGTKVRATGRTSDGQRSRGLIRQVHPVTLASMETALTADVLSGSAGTGTSAMALGAAVTADGDAEIAERGFVYAVTAVNSNPQIGGVGVVKQAVPGTAVGSFSAVASGLLPATTYSFRSYATNSAGTSYSAPGTFTTAALGAASGDLQAGFNPDANWDVANVAVQADGKVLIGGWFTAVAGAPRNRIARLNADGSLDTGFNPDANNWVYTVAVQADGKVLIGGAFTAVGGIPRNRVARLNADGSLDTGFNPNVDGNVLSLVAQPDGKVLIGGLFSGVNGTLRIGMARLNADGSLDAAYNPNVNNGVYRIVRQADGRVLLGGWFTMVGGALRSGVARLDADGYVDVSFNPGTGANDLVAALAVQSDGKVLLGGSFTSMNGADRNGMARLNADGSLDTSFNPNPNGGIFSLAIQTDGRVLIGGGFTMVGGVGRNRIARLSVDGSVDTRFDPNANGAVYGMVLEPDGKLLIGGDFTSIDGVVRNRIARLNATYAAPPPSQHIVWESAMRSASPEGSDSSLAYWSYSSPVVVGLPGLPWDPPPTEVLAVHESAFHSSGVDISLSARTALRGGRFTGGKGWADFRAVFTVTKPTTVAFAVKSCWAVVIPTEEDVTASDVSLSLIKQGTELNLLACRASERPQVLSLAPGRYELAASVRPQDRITYQTRTSLRLSMKAEDNRQPPPVVPQELVAPRLELSGPIIRIVIPESVLGRRYQLQSTTSLLVDAWDNWNDIGLPRMGDGGALVFTTEKNASRMFFRVALDPR